MFRRLTAFVLPVAFAMLVSACSSVTPAKFQRGFIASGACLELTEDADGRRTQTEVPGTPMERLFKKYLDENPSSGFFGAFFFHQDKDGAGSGPGAADSVNRAAFLALDLPADRGASVAAELRTCLLKNNLQRAEEIFDELAAEAGVDVRLERFPKNGGFRSYCEFKVGDDGEPVPHGLTRNFHQNGMISDEQFYRNGQPEGERRAYSELGELLTGE